MVLRHIVGKAAALGEKFARELGPFAELLFLAVGLLVLFLLSKAGLLVPDFLGERGLGGWGFLVAFVIGWGVFLAAVFAVIYVAQRREAFRRWTDKFRRRR